MPEPLPLNLPLYESPFRDASLRAAGASEAERALAAEFAERGYVVLDLEPEVVGAFDSVIEELAPRYPELDRRVPEAWYDCEGVRAIACSKVVTDALGVLYGRRAFPFQTLNFDRGTEQAAHSDTIHFHCAPARFMCGVWAALEDMDEDNGALFVHPGSHRLHDFDMHDLGLPASPSSYDGYEELVARVLEAAGCEREVVRARRGQAIVWAANLFHGGSPVRDRARTRHSQATHYYFDDCTYYFPMGTDPLAGRVSMREVIDIETGRYVPHRHRGAEVRLQDYRHVWCYPRPLPDWVERAEAAAENGSEDVDGELGELRRRVRALERTVDYLREDSLRIHEDNVAKDAFIAKRNDELAYKIARRITKTARMLMGKPKEER